MKKLSLGKYPYTYARVSVMRSSLLTKEDYQKLMKMSLNEIISFLQSSTYKNAIDEYGVQYSGVELMEMALNKNLVNTWNKLKSISSKEVGILIASYLARADLWNVKTILRGLHTSSKPEVIEAMLLPVGKLSEKDLGELIKSESVEDFLRKLTVIGLKFEALNEAFDSFKRKNNISDIENFLDRAYYNKMIQFSKTIPSEGKLFKQFLDAEVEMLNIMTVLRLRQAKIDKATIAKHIIGKTSTTVKKLIDSEKEELLKSLSAYAPDVQEYDLSKIEIAMGKNLLQKTRLLLHQHPLTVDVILGFMFAKEIEVKNLKMLLKSRQLNLTEQFIEQQIII